jgi:hypothetical protein
LPIWVNDPVSDAAAKTVIGPLAPAALLLPLVGAVVAVSAVSLPHAVRATAVTAAKATLIQRALTGGTPYLKHRKCDEKPGSRMAFSPGTGQNRLAIAG